MIFDGLEYECRINGWILTKNVFNSSFEINIPPEIDGTPVVAIADHVFADNEHLEVVAIPKSITSIGNYAFANCENLRLVKETNCKLNSKYRGLKLNKAVFQGCKKLEKVLLSSWIMLQGGRIFQRCHALEEIGVTGENRVYGNIPEQCFQACISLEHLTIEKPTCIIHNNAFNWCSCLKTLTFYSNDVSCEDEDTWKSLRRTKIQCLPNCNLTALGYDGVEVEVLENML